MAKATRLTLVCHGATPAVRTGAFPADEALEPGETQRAQAIAGHLRHAHRVLTSPALRARQTADALGLESVVDAALAEIDYGQWAGQAFTAVHDAQPDDVADWMHNPVSAPHGGESIHDFLVRIADWMRSHLNDGGHTIVVTHASVVRAAVLSALQAPDSAFWRIDVEPLSCIEMSSDGVRWMLRAAACLPPRAAGILP
ncbi:broad specificity phosphatase PhoE [Phyllobacterium myrsinacearum]|uniref:histidine phosphatase family protein n=1 Tax=Phyllobacterium myrsinacearum TaxID=28101 RepID=UPI001029A70F|nr:histidine phosphatase family protein [Phyllobacterium myrsinacearum]RZS89146.1 broad specificity phosphatase PhoE [Phyllobacterium myrsinacearum]